MPLRFLNTLSRSLETFTPLDSAGRTVRLYTCGPTVYNFAHIGNFRAYIFEDLLQRHLEARGFDVQRVMNLTDVDDKTIRGCREAGIPLTAFTARFKQAFFEDLDALRIKRANHFPEATDPAHIARMIAMISQLEQQGQAYLADDGSVYFRIARFKNYGRLAHLNLDELRPSGRIKSDEFEKESLGDFALWKAWDEQDGDVAWESPWGRGRPGWHIECSAMSKALLGDTIDLHTGGVDLLFPHHENEIAQSECCNGVPFARHWYHSEHLLVDGTTMSKSKGNYHTLRDLVAKGHEAMAVRYALLMGHPRKQLNFTLDSLHAAASALRTLRAARAAIPGAGGAVDVSAPVLAALRDDLNFPGALGALFAALNATAPAELNAAGFDRALFALGLDLSARAPAAAIPAAVTALAERRWTAKQARDFAAADALRAELAAAGWTMLDRKDGWSLEPVRK